MEITRTGTCTKPCDTTVREHKQHKQQQHKQRRRQTPKQELPMISITFSIAQYFNLHFYNYNIAVLTIFVE